MLENRTLISSTTTVQGKIELYDNPTATVSYADGVGQFMGNNGVVKLQLYNTIEVSNLNGQQDEKRELVQTLTMPSATFYGFILQVLPLLKQQVPAFEAQKIEIDNLIRAVMAQS